MILVILTAFVAVCGAAKLDNTYLPPLSAKTAGGSAGSLLAPLDGSNKGLPSGSFTNDVQGVVVDAVNPGTRTSGHEPTGLGAPRPSYGSKDSRVGEAAFSGSVNTRIAPGFDSFVKSGDAQAHKANGNTLKFTSDVGLENYSYGFETDNGISVGENGEAADGVKAQGGYSYQGDDGKTYSVSYTADEGGYKPQGEHLPTSPPIPDEILISLEKNAKEEAAGHVDDGSYDAQKYNDEGDYSSNGSGNNNGRLTIGSGVATSGGSQVSQSSHRPTSGVLVGAYKPSTVATHSSQGSSGQGFSQGSTIGEQAGSKDGNSLSHGSSSHGAHAGLSSHSTENRFGVQPTNSEGNYAHDQASVGGSILRSPSFVDGASAFSSAVTRGPGSASAFASSGPLNSGLKNNNLPTLNSFQTAGQHIHGSESSFGVSLPAPSTATASASVSGVQNSGSHAQSYSPNLPSSASASSSVSGNQLSYGSNQAAHSFGSSPTPANSASSTHTGAVDVNYASSTQKPFSGQQQGIDNSYIYKHPSKPFVTPSAKPSSQYTNNHQPNFPVSSITQQGSKYPNTPTTTANGQYQGTSSPSYDGITQAAISSFTSTSSSTQFGPQSSQFGTKPSTQFGQSGQQTSTQFGSSETHKPIVQSQTQFGQSSSSQTSDSSQSPTQQYQGTIYQYNKPATTLPAQGNKDSSSSFAQATFSQTNSQAKPVKTETGSKFGIQQSSSQFGSQSTFQTGSNAPTSQFGQKPIVSSLVSGSKNQFGSSGSQFGQKPLTTQGSTNSPNTQGQTSFEQKPVGSSQTTSQFGSIGSQIGSNIQSSQGSGQKPLGSTNQQTQFGSQFGLKPTQGSSFTYSQSTSQTPQFGKKPDSTTQFGTSGSQIGHSSQFGSSGSQFSQNAQSAFGSGSVSSTTKPSFSQKPFGSSNQQTQFGSIGSQFGQNVQSSLGTGSISSTGKPSFGSSYQQTQFGSKPQTTQGSSFTYSQSTSQTSQFEKKPVITTQTGVPSQQTQFGSSGAQFSQNTQSTLGSGSVSSTTKPLFSQKPFGSSNQQTQFGSTGSQFGQNGQSSLGTGLVSSTGKPSFDSSYQQTQFGSKPQTTQGSSYTYSQSQTSQYGNKPVISTTQTATQQSQFGSTGTQVSQALTPSKPSFGQKPFGSSSQQTLSGSTSSGSQFDQNSHSIQGVGSTSTNSQTSFGIKPVYQQAQFGSAASQNSQGQTSQFGKKPVSTTLTLEQSQFGSSGSQFGQNAQPTQGSGADLSSSKPVNGQQPYGSSYQQTQFGSSVSQFGENIQSSQGLGSVSTTFKPTFGQASFGSSSQQTQFGSQFGKKPQSTQGSSSTSNTYSQSQTSQFGKKPETSQTGSVFQQNQFGSTGSQFGQKPLTTTVTGLTSTTGQASISQSPSSTVQGGSFSQQSHFGSIGSHLNQKPQTATQGSSYVTNTESKGPVVQTTQFGITDSSQNGPSSQSIQYGSGNKFSGSASDSEFNLQQTQLAGSSGSQFGHTTQTAQGIISQVQPVQTTQYGIKPFDSSQNTQGSTQFGSTPSRLSDSSQTAAPIVTTISQTVQQFGQKPFQNEFGSTAGQFGQKPQAQANAFASSGNVVPFGITQTGQGFVSSTQKPLGSSLSQTNYQKVQQTQSNFNSAVSTLQKPINNQPLKPVGFSSTQGSIQQLQSTVSSSQFGTQSAKPAEVSGSVIQTSYNQLSGQPFQPASTASTHGSNAQSSAVFTSQSGLQSSQPAVTTHFDRKPLGSSSTQRPSFGSQTLVGSKPNPSVFSGGQASSVLSGVGSHVGPVVSTVQTPIVSGPGYDIVTSNQGGAHGFVGLGEQFGGPREPPSFDEKTGYHY